MLVDGRKVAGILVEGRPQERWAVLGVGLNVAVRAEEFPPELRSHRGDAGAGAGGDRAHAGAAAGGAWRAGCSADAGEVLAAVRARDALRGPDGALGGR